MEGPACMTRHLHAGCMDSAAVELGGALELQTRPRPPVAALLDGLAVGPLLVACTMVPSVACKMMMIPAGLSPQQCGLPSCPLHGAICYNNTRVIHLR